MRGVPLAQWWASSGPQVFAEHLLSARRLPTSLLHSQSNSAGPLFVTTVDVGANRVVCPKPSGLAFHPVFSDSGPCSHRQESYALDPTGFASISRPLTPPYNGHWGRWSSLSYGLNLEHPLFCRMLAPQLGALFLGNGSTLCSLLPVLPRCQQPLGTLPFLP